MKTCWQMLNIEATTDVEIIRQAYLSLLPSFHPENDPQGFKQLREAYEIALQETKPLKSRVMKEETNTVWMNELQADFHDLLADGKRRFQPQAWQIFIQQLNKLSLPQIETSRWLLCEIAMQAPILSYSCAMLLAQRLNWGRLDNDDEIDPDALENFLLYLQHGDIFDLTLMLHLPVEVQNHTLSFYHDLENTFFQYPRQFSLIMAQHGAVYMPDDPLFQRRLLRWFSYLHMGVAELLPIAQAWRQTEPQNSSADYLHCAQRVYCGEGESLLPELCALWQQHPSTQADELLLRWCRLHRPDYFPLLIMAIEAREQVNINGESLRFAPGSSARTLLLWAEALHSGELSPLSCSFIARRLDPNAPPLDKSHRQHPYWTVFQFADSLACADAPLSKKSLKKCHFDRTCPLESLVMHTLAELASHDERVQSDDEVSLWQMFLFIVSFITIIKLVVILVTRGAE
ncbi:J domain-containing protein [Enterobacter sp.]|uniref:J domain-containing protein n=1 Tax=Enterobacter sp. TaxID=42895 RepID=UPI003A900BB4